MAFRRLPNNFGTVYKLNGNRRRPWIARRRIGEVWDDEKHYSRPIYSTIGYFTTRKEAMEALAKAPENLIVKPEPPTFGEVYDLWVQEKYGSEDDLNLNYVYAKTYLMPIFRKKITALRTIDLETVIMTGGTPRTMQNRVKILIRQVYDYALRHEIVEKDYSALIRVNIDMSTASEKTVFTASEIKSVWNMVQGEKRDLVLILLYTGMRINELLKLTAADFHDGYFIAGSKTEAGKDRVIPVHSAIADIISDRLKHTKGRLFKLTSNTYRVWMRETMHHQPHECRHTFATQALECGMNDVARKRILGHASRDITNKTYTHLDIEFLKAEMEKLRY